MRLVDMETWTNDDALCMTVLLEKTIINGAGHGRLK
jgi:hypothetical protein